MNERISFSGMLRSELRTRQKTNANYSLRAFARTLGLSPSYLSKLMTGKRGASEETLLKIASRLKWRDEHVDPIWESQDFKAPDTEFVALDADRFRMIADWHHYAILEAVTLEDFNPKPEWIAARLSISVERARTGLERLLRLGLLTVDKRGKFSTVVASHSTRGANVPTSANSEHERQVLEGAIAALEKIPVTQRHQGSVTMAIPASRLDEAREKIRAFRRELMASLQRRGKRDSIYQLSVSLYPLTTIQEKKK